MINLWPARFKKSVKGRWSKLALVSGCDSPPPRQGEMVLQSHVTLANIRTLSLRRGKQKICNPDFLLFRKGDSVIHGNNALLEIFAWEPTKINVKTSQF